MPEWKYLLVFTFVLPVTAGGDQPTAQEANATRHGYVLCAGVKGLSSVPIFEHPCKPPVGELKCGDPVEVVSRKGPFLRLRTADGSERYVGATSVSQSQKKFIAVDLPFVPWPNLADCSAFQAQPGTHRPIPLYTPDPEYTEEARIAKISGTVLLSLTVGTDGIPRDIVVTRSLGHGLDEKAMEAVRQWKFAPAAEDGKPIPGTINIEVLFRMY